MNNNYGWSTCADFPTCSPTGTAYTDFLVKLNTNDCWSANPDGINAGYAWGVWFGSINGLVIGGNETLGSYVRAVRGGP